MALSGNTTTDLQLTGQLSEPRMADGTLANVYYRGYSAYEIAVQHGYQGTEAEWLAAMFNYEELSNLPRIENVALIGNKSLSDIGLQALSNMEIENLLN